MQGKEVAVVDDEEERPTAPVKTHAGEAAPRAGTMRTPVLGVRVSPGMAEGRKTLDEAAVAGLLRMVGTDGHGIYAVDALVAAGLPPALVMRMARWHRPLGAKGGSLRGADGREAGAVWGVHGLELLLVVARGLGLELMDLPSSWRQAGYMVAVALAAWVVQHGGAVIPLEPMPAVTVAPPPGQALGAEEAHSGRTPTALMPISPEAAELIRGRPR